VETERGQIFSERLGRLDFISSAKYFSEEEVWSEFLSTVGNPENLKKVIGSPIPGYIEVKFKKKNLDETSLKRLIVIAEKENLAKDILYGGTSFYRMMRIKWYLNASLLAAYVLLLLIMVVFLYYLDADLLLVAANELSFMKEHGKGAGYGGHWKLAGSAWEGFITGCVSFAISAFSLNVFSLKFPSMKTILAFPSISDYRSFLLPFVGVVFVTSGLYVLISYMSQKKVMKIVTGER
jgi:cell division protein FtsX